MPLARNRAMSCHISNGNRILSLHIRGVLLWCPCLSLLYLTTWNRRFYYINDFDHHHSLDIIHNTVCVCVSIEMLSGKTWIMWSITFAYFPCLHINIMDSNSYLTLYKDGRWCILSGTHIQCVTFASTLHKFLYTEDFFHSRIPWCWYSNNEGWVGESWSITPNESSSCCSFEPNCFLHLSWITCPLPSQHRGLRSATFFYRTPPAVSEQRLVYLRLANGARYIECRVGRKWSRMASLPPHLSFSEGLKP